MKGVTSRRILETTIRISLRIDPGPGQERRARGLQGLEVNGDGGEGLGVDKLFRPHHPYGDDENQDQHDPEKDGNRANLPGRQDRSCPQDGDGAQSRGHETEGKDGQKRHPVEKYARLENHAVGKKDGQAEEDHHPGTVNQALQPAGQEDLLRCDGKGNGPGGDPGCCIALRGSQ